MEHQSGAFPEHLREEHERVTERLKLASERLQEAQAEYNEAVLARIALSNALYKYDHDLDKT